MSIAPSGEPVPHRRRADEEPRVDGLVVGRRAVPLRPDDLRAGDLHVVERDRAGLVPAEAEGVPQRGLRLAVLLVDHEDREVVVALELGAGGLDDVEVGEAARRGPRRLLRDAVAAVRALRLGRDRVPEVRSRLGVGVRQRPDHARVERPDVLVDQLGRRAEHDRLHRADVHDVTHRRRRAAVPRDRLARHRERDVVLTEAAVLLGHGQPQEAVLSEQLEVAPREEELVVGALRVRAHLLLAELDQRRAKLLLPVGEDPVRIPVVAESPERLGAPHLLGHAATPGSSVSGPSYDSASDGGKTPLPCGKRCAAERFRARASRRRRSRSGTARGSRARTAPAWRRCPRTPSPGRGASSAGGGSSSGAHPRAGRRSRA